MQSIFSEHVNHGTSRCFSASKIKASFKNNLLLQISWRSFKKGISKFHRTKLHRQIFRKLHLFSLLSTKLLSVDSQGPWSYFTNCAIPGIQLLDSLPLYSTLTNCQWNDSQWWCFYINRAYWTLFEFFQFFHPIVTYWCNSWCIRDASPVIEILTLSPTIHHQTKTTIISAFAPWDCNFLNLPGLRLWWKSG